MKRATRRFGELEKIALLHALRECRLASLAASNAALLGRKDVRKGCETLQSAIDDLAAMLTGDREHFWGKRHSSADYIPARAAGD